jgi:hypothetical protein
VPVNNQAVPAKNQAMPAKNQAMPVLETFSYYPFIVKDGRKFFYYTIEGLYYRRPFFN